MIFISHDEWLSWYSHTLLTYVIYGHPWVESGIKNKDEREKLGFNNLLCKTQKI